MTAVAEGSGHTFRIRLVRAFGNREFVALEVSEYIKRLAAFGLSRNPSKAKRSDVLGLRAEEF